MRGSIIHPRYRIIEEIRLINSAIGRGDLASPRQAGPKHRGTLKLRLHHVGIGHNPGIQSRVHIWNADSTLRIHFDLHNCSDVSQETPVHRVRRAESD